VKILILIRSWNRGGAERQCALTARELARRGHNVQAVSVYAGGCFASMAAQHGAAVMSLGRRHKYDVIAPFIRLKRLVRDFAPDVIYSFMPLANIVSVLVRGASPAAACVWGVRATAMAPEVYGIASRLSVGLERRLIAAPEALICNSDASRQELSPWRSANVFVVENGIDTQHFSPAPTQRATARRQLGVDDDSLLVGIVGRLDPMKDHQTFLEAAALLARHEPVIRFVVAGGSAGPARALLQQHAQQLGIAERIAWLDSSDDVVSTYRALDVLVSSSAFGEGFSNVIAEAMACGVPVVATHVGDAARLIGGTGLAVRPKSPQCLADAVKSMLQSDLRDRGLAARSRIVQQFGVDACMAKTEAVLASAVSVRRESTRGLGSPA
jgi:glycosyltransferase involved in cell wall biosynthesis